MDCRGLLVNLFILAILCLIGFLAVSYWHFKIHNPTCSATDFFASDPLPAVNPDYVIFKDEMEIPPRSEPVSTPTNIHQRPTFNSRIWTDRHEILNQSPGGIQPGTIPESNIHYRPVFQRINPSISSVQDHRIHEDKDEMIIPPRSEPVHPTFNSRIWTDRQEILNQSPAGIQPGSIPEYNLHHPSLFQRINPTISFVHDQRIQEQLNYQKKYDTFKSELEKLRVKTKFYDDKLSVKVRRSDFWNDIYFLADLNSERLQKKLTVEFIDEDGTDLGGLTRTFFSMVASIINDQNNALFTSSVEDNCPLRINPDSAVHGNHHLQYFKLIGRLIGMAILSENNIGIRLSPSLYRNFRTQPIYTFTTDLPNLLEEDQGDVDLSDIKAVDTQLYKNLNRILSNDITDDGYTFAITPGVLSPDPIELVKNGSEHKVTQANKRQYVREYARWYMDLSVKDQANALRDGVWDVVPMHIISAFTDSELELLIGGKSVIDLQDWKDNTIYEGGYSKTHPSVIDFWRCVEGMDNTNRSKLLQFATGSPRVPSTGFSHMVHKFKISQAFEITNLPTSHTCFNEICFPDYKSYDKLCRSLDIAIEEQSFELL